MSGEQVKHQSAGCDVCRTMPINGIRYKCATCLSSYDLCSTCKPSSEHGHPHWFKIHTDQGYRWRPPKDLVYTVGSCNGCNKEPTANGVWYKCIQPDCKQPMLCTVCEVGHPIEHILLSLALDSTGKPIPVEPQDSSMYRPSCCAFGRISTLDWLRSTVATPNK